MFDKNYKKVSFLLDEGLYNSLQSISVKEQISISAIIRRILISAIDKDGLEE